MPALVRRSTAFAGSLLTGGGSAAVPTCVSIPNFSSNVKLLCHFDGTNGSTTFIDSSPVGRSLTGVSAAALTTAQQKFGTASLDLAGSNKAVSAADSADWNFASGQFTVGCWARATALPNGSGQLYGLIAQSNFNSVSNIAFFFGFFQGVLSFYYTTNGSTFSFVGSAYTPTLNTFVDYKADRDASNVLRVYANGAVIASGTVSASFFDSSAALRIGNDVGGLATWPGQVDEALVIKGSALYGEAYTSPTLPFCDV